MTPAITKEAFAEFCESKPADEKYEYTDSQNCAFCQFLKHLGFKYPGVWPSSWRPDGRCEADRQLLPEGVGHALVREPETFGALAARLREAV